jgi:hypothetical protein
MGRMTIELPLSACVNIALFFSDVLFGFSLLFWILDVCKVWGLGYCSALRCLCALLLVSYTHRDRQCVTV